MFTMLNPSDSMVDWVVEMVPQMGAGWCPPGMLGVGIGGSAEKSRAARQEVADGADRHGELMARGAQNDIEELRIEIYRQVNALGIGAQGLGGLDHLSTSKSCDFPDACGVQAGGRDPELRRHPPCAFHARRLGTRLARTAGSRRYGRSALGARCGAQSVDLDRLTAEQMRSWKPGERLLLSGKMLTGRDAAHKRISDMLDQRRSAAGRFQGPRDLLRRPGRSGARRSGGTGRPDHRHAHGRLYRHDARHGLLAIVGKAERGPAAIEVIRDAQIGLSDRGGRRGVIWSRRRSGEPRAWLSPSSAWRRCTNSRSSDMPVTVAVSSDGDLGARHRAQGWRGKFAGIPVAVE